YIGFGWILVVALPELSRRLSPAHIALLLAGGLAYTLGAIVLGTKWPDPNPKVFGYHEVWHALVIVACACHYATIYSVIRTAA
ncbi:MAG: hemolysin III family protein, partial [Acidimicrobiales bacterium]